MSYYISIDTSFARDSIIEIFNQHDFGVLSVVELSCNWVKSFQVKVRNSTISISHVEAEDTGDWECTASNTWGEISHTFQVEVQGVELVSFVFYSVVFLI